MTQSKGQMAEMLFQAVHGVTGVSGITWTAALYLGKNLGIIIGIGKSGFFSSCADGFSLTKILQASLNAVFLEKSK